MLDVVLMVLLFAGILFPVAYCFYFALGNKMLFLFAVYGAELVIGTLLSVAALPAIVLIIYGLPQLNEFGIELRGLWIVADLAAKHFWQVSATVLFVLLPPLLARRYRAYFQNEPMA